nr:NPF-3 [Urechis unicinctus]
MQTIVLIGLVAMTTVATCASFKLYDLPSQQYRLYRTTRTEERGAPKRPQSFQSVAELNRYLSDITDYYTVLGRPRFGKRSLESEKVSRPLSFESKSQLKQALAGAKTSSR